MVHQLRKEKDLLFPALDETELRGYRCWLHLQGSKPPLRTGRWMGQVLCGQEQDGQGERLDREVQDLIRRQVWLQV